jgi:arylsulfatase A
MKTIKKNSSFFLIGFLFLISVNACNSAKSQKEVKRPNFILILSDDQGWNGTSVQMMDSEPFSKSDYYSTPNTEKLAARGMRFSSGYAPAAVCAPTRYSILFGQTPARLQMTKVGMNTDHIDHEKMLTIPKLLKSIDPEYKAAHFGKWHIDAEPALMGYDESDGMTTNRTGGYTQGMKKWTNFKISNDPKKIFSVTKASTDFMEKQVKAGKPFYLQVSHYAVHADLVMKQETLDKYNVKNPGKIHDNAGFAAMTENLDTGVGMLLDKVKELGIEDNTYIIYMADNGSVPVIPPNTPYDSSYNYPLSRGKWDLMEGGIRIPFIVSGPGIKAGEESKVPAAGFDILPTLADLAGGKVNLPDYLDGGSLKNVLLNSGEGKINRSFDALLFHNPNANGIALNRPHSALRQGPYKLVKFQDNGELLLFDLEQDIGEKNNLAEEMPERVKQLEDMLDMYLTDVHAPKWEKGIDWKEKFVNLNSVY